MIKPANLKLLKETYPKGTKIRLLKMNDPYREIKSGLIGTVKCVDDVGTIHVVWEDGGTLGVIYGVDNFEKL